MLKKLGHRLQSAVKLGHRNVEAVRRLGHKGVLSAMAGDAGRVLRKGGNKAMLAGDALEKSYNFLKGAETSASGIHPKLGIAAGYVADKMKVGGDLAHKLGRYSKEKGEWVKKNKGLLKQM